MPTNFERITNNQIKLFKSLKRKKFRQKYGLYCVEGDKVARELIDNYSDEIDWIVLKEDNQGSLSSVEDKVLVADQPVFQELSSLNTPQNMLLVMKMPLAATFNAQQSLYLDGIQDPGNMGTIIRTADWFGMSQIVLGEGCVDPFNSKVVQAAMGSLSRVELINADISSLSDDGYAFIAADLDGELAPKDLKDFISQKVCIVLGSEGQGISSKVQAYCDYKLTIPSKGHIVESLNVAIAAGIILHELSRI